MDSPTEQNAEDFSDQSWDNFHYPRFKEAFRALKAQNILSPVQRPGFTNCCLNLK
jgi:hypothetical protein